MPNLIIASTYLHKGSKNPPHPVANMLNLIIASTYLHKGWWWGLTMMMMMMTMTMTMTMTMMMMDHIYIYLLKVPPAWHFKHTQPFCNSGAAQRHGCTVHVYMHAIEFCVSWLWEWEPNKLQYITVKALSIDVRVSCFQDQIGRTLSEGQAKDLMWTPVAWHVEKYDGRCWKLLAHLTLALRFVVWFEVGCFHFGHPSTLGASGCHRDKTPNFKAEVSYLPVSIYLWMAWSTKLNGFWWRSRRGRDGDWTSMNEHQTKHSQETHKETVAYPGRGTWDEKLVGDNNDRLRFSFFLHDF